MVCIDWVVVTCQNVSDLHVIFTQAHTHTDHFVFSAFDFLGFGFRSLLFYKWFNVPHNRKCQRKIDCCSCHLLFVLPRVFVCVLDTRNKFYMLNVSLVVCSLFCGYAKMHGAPLNETWNKRLGVDRRARLNQFYAPYMFFENDIMNASCHCNG